MAKSFRGSVEETLADKALEIMDKMNEAIEGKRKYTPEEFEADNWFIRSLKWVLRRSDEEIVNKEIESSVRNGSERRG